MILTGFIADEEVTDHYLLADVFVMPSKGEGFGIVYLEAMACGLPVIAGNKDGSTEALQFGKLGTLINPDDEDELLQALQTRLQQPSNPLQVQQQMLEYFAFPKFRERLHKVLTVISNPCFKEITYFYLEGFSFFQEVLVNAIFTDSKIHGI